MLTQHESAFAERERGERRPRTGDNFVFDLSFKVPLKPSEGHTPAKKVLQGGFQTVQTIHTS